MNDKGWSSRGAFSDMYMRCGTCRYFEKEDTGFTASNLCRCTIDGRDHWAGDPAKECESFDDA